MSTSPGSPSSISFDTESHYSEVPTEHQPPHERQMVNDRMLRRRYFLSDYEKYNPVQNMHMLANHVFDLTEGILRLDNNFAGSRRMLDFVATNQRDVDASVRAVGNDLSMFQASFADETQAFKGSVTEDIGGLREDINFLRSEMQSIRRETQQTQQGIQELKQLLMTAVRG